MRTDADKAGLLTVGGRDSRITKVGYFIRKYKLDELPQLIKCIHRRYEFSWSKARSSKIC